MSWLEHHTQSEQYASLAEVADREGELVRLQEFYRLAAESEACALEALDGFNLLSLAKKVKMLKDFE